MKNYWTKPISRWDLMKDGLVGGSISLGIILAMIFHGKSCEKKAKEKDLEKRNFRKYIKINRKEE